ncbi:MAG: MarR family transcriptional regulator [Candidatus Devosia symbiotica]|nr:MarR family transcriptional regulator [Candidatus Devosia symbiotica]
MAAYEKNVNKTDINYAGPGAEVLPLDIMGLFFFAYRDFTGDADAMLGHQGFGRAHHRVLYFICLRPGMPVADLLDILKITKQSLARVLRQLIDNGYVEQKTGRSDRRQRLLFATDKGRDFFGMLSATQASRINDAISSLPQDASKIVTRFLAGMVDPNDQAILERLNLTTGP